MGTRLAPGQEEQKLEQGSARPNTACVCQGTLHISGDGLRVADSETKGLVLDQTIEKVCLLCTVFTTKLTSLINFLALSY